MYSSIWLHTLYTSLTRHSECRRSWRWRMVRTSPVAD